jgi:predicted ArsR family transcriptional regulator
MTVLPDDLSALTALVDPTRRRLYEIVVDAARPLRRDEAAAAAGISRPLAAYHLDRLVEAGLLEVGYGRFEGRAGPGAGRPAKLYRRGSRAFRLQIPARQYDVLSEVLARAATAKPSVRAVAVQAARQVGEHASRHARQSLLDLLRERGYEPFEPEPGLVRLRNCPFEALAASHPALVCGLNLALVEGMLEGLGSDAAAALAPAEGVCCVAIRRAN